MHIYVFLYCITLSLFKAQNHTRKAVVPDAEVYDYTDENDSSSIPAFKRSKAGNSDQMQSKFFSTERSSSKRPFKESKSTVYIFKIISWLLVMRILKR